MVGKKAECFMAITKPPLAIGRLEAESVIFKQIERGPVSDRFAGGQGDSQEIGGTVDVHRSKIFGITIYDFRFTIGGRCGLGRFDGFGLGIAQMFTDATEDGSDPEERFLRIIDQGKALLAF